MGAGVTVRFTGDGAAEAVLIPAVGVLGLLGVAPVLYGVPVLNQFPAVWLYSHTEPSGATKNWLVG